MAPHDTPTLLQLPFLAIAYLQPGRRQDPDWTYRQALYNSALKALLDAFAFCRIKPGLSLRAGFERDRFVLIEPGRPELYTGIAQDKEVKPEVIGGTWYPKRLPSDFTIPEGGHIVLHLHGGSYIMGDGRTASCQFLAKNLLSHTPARYVLCLQYRLAVSPKTRFPAQLQDAISAYSYMIHTLHIPPTRIILSGDSAGGHLVLALLRYIVNFGGKSLLPPPKCSWLWSPWCDVPAGAERTAWIKNPKYSTDYTPGSLQAWGAKNFLRNLHLTAAVEEYVAPIKHPFPLPSPMFIVSGGARGPV
ncbi:hypothetical protein N7468_009619 [Penicillium chermesinum]|uniref:Alpha/beta hydrolase fold-3 domain-containing protein n=1 Tax=Penicillium chermesinum TaxID=63820 RepID=A0A9W9TGA9_9EURO|nr:uncharacterized protein N7468_009619 [Penicillium chermesinum]KAJ5220415.1 hypothetical protein N7468_009619 [Penicillium chermesinum]